MCGRVGGREFLLELSINGQADGQTCEDVMGSAIVTC